MEITYLHIYRNDNYYENIDKIQNIVSVFENCKHELKPYSYTCTELFI